MARQQGSSARCPKARPQESGNPMRPASPPHSTVLDLHTLHDWTRVPWPPWVVALVSYLLGALQWGVTGLVVGRWLGHLWH